MVPIAPTRLGPARVALTVPCCRWPVHLAIPVGYDPDRPDHVAALAAEVERAMTAHMAQH